MKRFALFSLLCALLALPLAEADAGFGWFGKGGWHKKRQCCTPVYTVSTCQTCNTIQSAPIPVEGGAPAPAPTPYEDAAPAPSAEAPAPPADKGPTPAPAPAPPAK